MLKRIKRFVVRDVLRKGHPARFHGSASYWDERYRRKGTSGAGSYGRLAMFKAEVVNRVIVDFDASSVVEWGCGDGAQLGLIEVADYTGVDVSPEAIRLCRDRYTGDPTKRFLTLDEALEHRPRGDVSLSLDVVYHLVEDEVYERYMRRLFESADRTVIVYSSNHEDPPTQSGRSPHIRHRRFTDWVEQHAEGWEFHEHIPNPYPRDSNDPANTSFADFHIFTCSAP